MNVAISAGLSTLRRMMISGSTLTIHDSGGVGDKITWTVQATDGCGNIRNRTCDTSVVNLREYREIYE